MKPLIDNFQLPRISSCCGSKDMKTRTIQIQEAENGFSINYMTNQPGKNKRLIATSEAQVTELVTQIAKDMFTPEQPKEGKK